MNVAILSMQEVKNYGSFLQAWSLKHTIESLGHNCEFINIVPGQQLGEFKQGQFDKLHKLITRLWGWDFWQRFQTIKTFQGRFSNEFLPELGVKLGEVNTKHYDVIVIGSDEVFNCAQKTWFGFSPQLFGQGLNANRIISYAGSFGATDTEKLVQIGVKPLVSELLKSFDAISIRDENSMNVVKELTDTYPEQHVDPVLIYNYDEQISHRIAKGFSLKCFSLEANKYMIVYTYPGRITNSDEISSIKKYAKNNHLKLVSIGHYFPWCDDVIVPHPFEALAIFKQANCIVTDTFHGSVFSLKYNKNFCTIVRDMNSNKLSYLLKQFGLADRIAKQPDEIGVKLRMPIDYTSVNNILIQEHNRSLDYLQRNLR